MRRGASGHRGRPKRAAQAVTEAVESNPYEYCGLAPDGLRPRVPVYDYGTRHQIGWLGYSDTRIDRI